MNLNGSMKLWLLYSVVIATGTNIAFLKGKDMAFPSAYRSLRPLMIICYWTGQFAVLCVTVDRSDLLCYHRLSKSLIALLIEVGTYSIVQLWDFSGRNISNMALNVKDLHSITVCIKVNSMFGWFYLGSKNMVQAIQAIDRMRETLTLVPSLTRQRPGNLRAHEWYIGALYMCFQTMGLAMAIAIISGNVNVCTCIIILLFGSSLVLQTVTLISLYYSCSLVVEDSCHLWFRCQTESLCPMKNINSFCQLILNQIMGLKELNQALGKHVLAILVVRIISLVHDLLYSAEMDYAEVAYVNDIAWWTSLFGFFFFSVNLISSKMDRFTGEVLNTELTLHGLSKRKAARVNVYIHNSNLWGIYVHSIDQRGKDVYDTAADSTKIYRSRFCRAHSRTVSLVTVASHRLSHTPVAKQDFPQELTGYSRPDDIS